MNLKEDLGGISISTSQVHIIEWSVENFFSDIEKFYFEWDSPTFQMYSGTWHLNMILTRPKFSFIQHIQVILVNDNFVDFAPFNCKIGIKMENGSVHNSCEPVTILRGAKFVIVNLDREQLLKRKRVYSSNDNIVFSVGIYPIIYFSSTFEENFTLNPEKRHSAEGRIVRRCEFEEGVSKDETLIELQDIDVHDLLRNLREIYGRSIYCDVTLKLGSCEFNAHKSVLSVNSPVFASMFEHNMKEKNTGVVKIEDCDPDSFQEFLEYLYTADKKDFSMDRIMNLYIIADKYEVKPLMKVCVQFMMNYLSIEVFCDVFKFAVKYNELSLINSAETFFARNVKNIVTTETWKSLMNESNATANALFMQVFK